MLNFLLRQGMTKFHAFFMSSTSKKKLESIKCLIPQDAYFGGHTNAVKLYYNCKGEETIHYLDVTSMYPYAMYD